MDESIKVEVHQYRREGCELEGKDKMFMFSVCVRNIDSLIGISVLCVRESEFAQIYYDVCGICEPILCVKNKKNSQEFQDLLLEDVVFP